MDKSPTVQHLRNRLSNELERLTKQVVNGGLEWAQMVRLKAVVDAAEFMQPYTS